MEVGETGLWYALLGTILKLSLMKDSKWYFTINRVFK